MPISKLRKSTNAHPTQYLQEIYDAVARLRAERLASHQPLEDILAAAKALELLASSGRAGCSAAESAVAQWTGGNVTPQYDAGYDVVSQNGSRLEVKYSKLNRPHKSGDSTRWNWTNILGNASEFKKPYDYLILVGQADERFLSDFPVLDGKFVVFAIPRAYVENDRSKIRLSSAARGTIALSTNPNLAHTRSMIELFAKSEADLRTI